MMLASLVSALKLDGINPVPDMTKRKTASKLITRGSWPPMRYSIQNASSTRSTTSLKELDFCIVLQGSPLPHTTVKVAARAATFFFAFYLLLVIKSILVDQYKG